MQEIDPLKSKLQNENSFYKIMLKIRAALSKKNVEAVYNTDLLAEYAKQLNKNKTPIINTKTEVLDYGFYQRFVVLKEAATYFSQLVELADDELGEFYFELIKSVSPDFAEFVNKKTDPSKLSQEQMDSGKAKETLVQAMEECVDNMNNDVREQLYESIYQANWLMNFTKLPFDKLSIYFQKMPDGLYVAYFSNIIDIYPQFCSVLVNVKSFRKEVFDALFEFNANHRRLKNPANLTKENLRKKIMEQTSEELAHISNFFTKEELITIGRIILKESTWQPPVFESEISWVAELKSAWKKTVESRWASYVQDVRKGRAFEKMQSFFKHNEFPMLPNRPWTAVRQKTLFSKEYSSGLMNWYITNIYEDALAFYKNILKEGDFLNLSNRNDFAEAINLLEVCSNQMVDMNFKLAQNGKFGQVFTQIIDGNMQYFRAQTHVETMMASVELDIQKSIDMFMKSMNLINNVFKGFSVGLGEAQIIGYEGLRNFDAMRGTQGGSWLEKFKQEHQNVQHMIEIMKELIVVDGTK